MVAKRKSAGNGITSGNVVPPGIHAASLEAASSAVETQTPIDLGALSISAADKQLHLLDFKERAREVWALAAAAADIDPVQRDEVALGHRRSLVKVGADIALTLRDELATPALRLQHLADSAGALWATLRAQHDLDASPAPEAAECKGYLALVAADHAFDLTEELHSAWWHGQRDLEARGKGALQ